MFENFRVLTFNCQKGYPGNTVSVVSHWLKQGSYDFLLLQEASVNVIENLHLKQAGYCMLSAYNHEVGVVSQLCILYKEKFSLDDSVFFSFANFKQQNSWRAEFGLLLGTFKYQESRFVVGSIHLNPGFEFIVRKRELFFIRKSTLLYNKEKLPVLFGGDFNSMVPHEFKRNAKILGPQFVNATLDSGPTAQTQYLEPTVFINRFALGLAKAGINFKGKVDHIYVDQDSSNSNIMQSRVLPDRASDHSPLELLFTKKGKV